MTKFKNLVYETEEDSTEVVSVEALQRYLLNNTKGGTENHYNMIKEILDYKEGDCEE